MNVFNVLREKVSDISELIRPVGWSRKIEVVETKAVIEIFNQVEQEYNNDVCEWELEKDMFIQNPHTGRKFSNEPSMKNVYCNTCGKKIKVVE